MSFTSDVFNVIVQPYGGDGIRFVSYQTDDDADTVTSAGYFVGVESYGARVNDLVFVSPIAGEDETYIVRIVDIDVLGNGTAELSRTDMSMQAFDTVADVEDARINRRVDAIYVSGYYDAGDGGGAHYKRVSSEPSHAGKIQSDDGAWWEIAENAVSVRMLGAKGDGTAGVDLAAINAALGVGRPVYVPKPSVKYLIDGPLTIPAGACLFSDAGKALIETSSSAIISANGIDGVSLSNLIFRGPHNGTSYHVTLTDCERWKFAGVEFENGNSGIDVSGGADHEWTDLDFRNIRGTCVKLRGGFVRGTFRSVHSKNVRNFTILVEDASRIDIYDLRRWYDASDITVYLAGEVVSGRLGNEALGVRYSGSFVRLFGHDISDINENSISLTGVKNEVHGGRISNGANTGIHLYGRENMVVGGSVRSCLGAGVQISANAGGIARRNKVIGVASEANDIGFHVTDDAYATWSSGGSTSTSYCKSVSGAITRVYESASGTVTTFGTVQPVHESGTVSDGVNDWTYIVRVTNSETLDARENTIIGCTANDNTNEEFLDDTVAAAVNTFIGNPNDTATWSLAPGSGTYQHTVISDTLSPQINQRRKLATGNGDVSGATVVGKWDVQGWLNGAFRFCGRVTWFVHSVAGSIVRAKLKINVTNSAGDDWAAFHLSEQGYLGIGNAVTFTENDPSCSLDVDGMAAANVRGDRARTDVTISSGAITVTGAGYVRVTTAGPASITDILSDDPYSPEVFIVANSGTITIVHDTNKIRCHGGADQDIVALQGGLRFKKQVGSGVWEQM